MPSEFGSYNVWQPGTPSGLLHNMVEAWTKGKLGQGTASTALYALSGPLLAVIIGAAAGFSIVALRLRRGFFWLIVIFSASIFPLQMILMPLFVGYAKTGLLDTRFGIVIIYTVMS